MKDQDIKTTDFVTLTGITGGRMVVRRTFATDLQALEDNGNYRTLTSFGKSINVQNTFDELCTKFSLGVTDALGDNTGLTTDE